MIRELIFTTSWEGKMNNNPETMTTGKTIELKFPEAVVPKHHVRRFMSEYGYEGLIPRMNLWCEAWKIDDLIYVRLSDLERITWPTFIKHMKELVEVRHKVIPVKDEVM